MIKEEEGVFVKKDIDRYKRIVAVCYYNNQNLNKLMVRNGWAIAYRRYSKDYTLMMRIMPEKTNLVSGKVRLLNLKFGEKIIENNLKKLIFGVGLDLF